MIDFHCHLDLYQNALKLLPIVAERNNFTLVVTTSPRAWEKTSQVFAGYNNIEVAVGLHPEVVAGKANEQALLMSSIPTSRFVGEVGLDGSYRYRETMRLQVSIFNNVLIECENAGGKIISVHSRNATSRVLDLIEKTCRNSIPVLHWFSGTSQEARRAVALGCWFSIGPAMLFGAKGRALLEEFPLKNILPETDGPFAMKHDVPFMPWEAISISDTLASLWGTTKDDIYKQMQHNLITLLNINPRNKEHKND